MTATTHQLGDPARFFEKARSSGLFGAVLEQSEVDGLNALLTAMRAWPLAFVAYGLATAYHETAHTVRPIKEYGGDAYFNRRYGPEGLNPILARQLGNTQPGDGARFAGRGYVQLTGRTNYGRASRELGADFVASPDLALNLTWAAAILAFGMSQGWFTGKKLADYLPQAGAGSNAQFITARRIINGNDRAAEIGAYALIFQDALLLGRWG